MLREGSVSCKSAGWMPCTLAALLGTGMIVSYIWAVSKKDVIAWMPFISDAGGNPPQSGVFALFLFFSAFVGLLTMLARHAVLHQEIFRLANKKLKWANHVALFLGMVSLTGMLIVGAYPVRSYKKLDVNATVTKEYYLSWKATVLSPHSLGAMCCFAVGLLYGIVQSFISLFIRPRLTGFWQGRHLHLFILRVVISLGAFAALVVMYATKQNNPNPWESSKTSPTRAVAEWILGLMLLLLFLSLYPEMKPVGLQVTAQGPPCERAKDDTEAICPQST